MTATPATHGSAAPCGTLGLTVVRADGSTRPAHPPRLTPQPAAGPSDGPSLAEIVAEGLPQRGLPDYVNAWRLANAANLWRGARRVLLARTLRLPHFYGQLRLTVVDADGRETPLGLASLRVVTTAGVGFIVDALQNLVELETMKYHGLGTGGTAEASGDTALVTELTTQLTTDSVRATGTTAETAVNIYQTVGVNAFDASVALTEHGVFSQAAVPGGVLLDRSLFSVVNLGAGESMQTDYRFTVPAGG